MIVLPASALEDVRYEGIPPLVVEVLSTNRSDDTVVKLQAYARDGVPRYWIVDPRDHELHACKLVEGVYNVAAELDRERSRGVLDVVGPTRAEIDLDELFA